MGLEKNAKYIFDLTNTNMNISGIVVKETKNYVYLVDCYIYNSRYTRNYWAENKVPKASIVDYKQVKEVA